jgi:hypothetical protein
MEGMTMLKLGRLGLYGAVGLLGLTLAACGSSGSSSSTTAPPSTAPTASPASSQSEHICQVTSGGGTYFLSVTNVQGQDLRACAGATTYSGRLDSLLNMPGMDRRCVLDSAASVAQYHAVVGIYSDVTSSNLKAAQTFCTDNHGTFGGGA